MALQFRRGTAADRADGAFVPANGEPIFETDTQKLYIGDGATVGGVNILNSYGIEDLNNVTPRSITIENPNSYAIASEVVTITFASSHSFSSGDEILIADSSVAALDGTHTLTSVDATDIVFTLVGASDVSSTALTADVSKIIPDGNVLTWDAATSQWLDSPVATDLASLSDVELASLADQEVLIYNSTSSKWENGTLSFASSVDELTDVSITSISQGQVLTYDATSSQWINSNPGLGSRVSVNGTASAVPDSTSADIDITGAKSYMLMSIETNVSARVVVYTSDAARTADVGRDLITDPLGGSGVIAEVITLSSLVQKITPGLVGWNDESPVNTTIYLAVTNYSGATSDVTVTLNILALEV